VPFVTANNSFKPTALLGTNGVCVSRSAAA